MINLMIGIAFLTAAMSISVESVNLTSKKIVEQEKLLIDKLFKDYDKRMRPDDTVQMKFSLYLNQIITLLERDQIVVLNVFLDHEWKDRRLEWSPAEHNNISLLRISSDLVWTPDTYIDTTAESSGFLIPQRGTQFILQSTGVIFWSNPMSQLKVRCRMNIAWFPFDEQLCTVIFGSWSYTSNCLNYSMLHEDPSLKNFTDNSEWILIKYKPTRFEIRYDHWFENQSFSEIKYQIIMKRKSLFVIQNYVTAAIFLCTLTLVSFFIPFAQAMQIGISILLSFAVFKLRLSDDVPVQSDTIPLINIYFTLCTSFSLFSMIWFSVLNYLKERKTLPCCLRYLILKYAAFLACICRRNPQIKNKKDAPSPLTENYLDETLISSKKNADILNVAGTSEAVRIVKIKEAKTSDSDLILILNKLVFYLFLTFIISLNLFCLFILPYFVKKPLNF